MLYNIDDPSRYTLTANSATPSVGNSITGDYITNNSSGTAYTDFTNGYDGQRINILVNDANTTFNHVATLIMRGGVNFAAPTGTIMTFRYEAATTRWREETRSAPCLIASATYDPPSLADGAGTTTAIAVVGAALGDIAMASFSLTTSGITITAWVSAADAVSVRFQNESGGVLDIGSGTLKCVVMKL